MLAKYDAEVLRLFLLGTHYRNPINYSDAILDEAERRLGYLYETLEKADRARRAAPPRRRGGAARRGRRRRRSTTTSTPRRCSAILAEAFTAANALADRKGKKTPEEKAALAALRARRARELGATLGILQRRARRRRSSRCARGPPSGAGIDPAAVEARLAERAEARKAKDFARGDAIRDELLASGVALMDGPHGHDLEGRVATPGASRRRARLTPARRRRAAVRRRQRPGR